ncbi:uncharacterized protein BXZ73DRAFT_105137 [Epithele typhae]|uniref:uncharacterized protein n=1 Tax=Epithele typhae TaxID=378194 RepID=UPI0020078A5E|nr:uncharacterized protein BXZ73DRAFT_105137 [Epithele typhae]KAH9918742.1 hypothetical protein BXZ73DRAFT_105137 [Epithele typhae]
MALVFALFALGLFSIPQIEAGIIPTTSLSDWDLLASPTPAPPDTPPGAYLHLFPRSDSPPREFNKRCISTDTPSSTSQTTVRVRLSHLYLSFDNVDELGHRDDGLHKHNVHQYSVEYNVNVDRHVDQHHLDGHVNKYYIDRVVSKYYRVIENQHTNVGRRYRDVHKLNPYVEKCHFHRHVPSSLFGLYRTSTNFYNFEYGHIEPDFGLDPCFHFTSYRHTNIPPILPSDVHLNVSTHFHLRHSLTADPITSTPPVLSPSSSTLSGVITTVETTTLTTNGHLTTKTYTTVIPTGNLIPGDGNNPNVFAHSKGALAGLIVGCVAVAGVILALAIFASRRHRVRHAENAALNNWSNRAMTLDDEAAPGSETHFIGAGSASRSGPLYDRLRGGNNPGSPGAEGDSSLSSADGRAQGTAGGGLLPPIPMLNPIGDGESAMLMHPANRSATEFNEPDLAKAHPPPPKSPALSEIVAAVGAGPADGATWVGGHPALSYQSMRQGSPISPSSPSPVLRPASEDSVYSDDVLSMRQSTGSPDLASDTAAVAALGGLYSAYHPSVSSHDHDRSSGHDHSSAHGHSSSAHGHGAGSSSGGHGSSSGHRAYLGSHDSHQPLIPHSPLLSRSPPPIAPPSSLLPTHRQSSAASRRRGPTEDDEGEDRRNSRVSGLFDRSLRGLRLRSARGSITSLSSTSPAPVSSPSASTTLLANVSPRASTHAFASAPAPAPAAEPPRPSSIYRPQSPALAGVLRRTSAASSIPAGAAPPAVPAARAPWALALGPLPEPSPALTEGSSTHAPDGLLDPRLGLLGQHGMRSQGAISFRDDMDYSRPIGGLVNNRQDSRMTIQTVSSTVDTLPRPSLESRDTETTEMAGRLDGRGQAF